MKLWPEEAGSSQLTTLVVGPLKVGVSLKKIWAKKKWTLVVYGLQFLGDDNKPFILLSPWLFGIIMLLS